LTISLTAVLLTGCSQKVHVFNECPTIKPLNKIENIDLVTDKNGSLTLISSYKAITLIRKLRVKEEYYDIETKRLNEKIKEFKEKQDE